MKIGIILAITILLAAGTALFFRNVKLESSLSGEIKKRVEVFNNNIFKERERISQEFQERHKSEMDMLEDAGKKIEEERTRKSLPAEKTGKRSKK